MKKVLFFLALGVFSLTTIFAGSPSETTAYSTDLKTGCEKMPVAINKVTTWYENGMFNYQINWCSQNFTSDKRYIKFSLMLIDENGDLIEETSTGPALDHSSELKEMHQAGISVSQEPTNCIIKWFYKDASGIGTATEWQLVSIRSVKLRE